MGASWCPTAGRDGGGATWSRGAVGRVFGRYAALKARPSRLLKGAGFGLSLSGFDTANRAAKGRSRTAVGLRGAGSRFLAGADFTTSSCRAAKRREEERVLSSVFAAGRLDNGLGVLVLTGGCVGPGRSATGRRATSFSCGLPARASSLGLAANHGSA